MSRALSHDEAFAALDAAALDALAPSEREAVMAHVADCVTCAAELASLRESASLLAFAAPMADASGGRERIKSRLMARVAADAREQRAATTAGDISVDRAERKRVVSVMAWRRAEWLALAASILLIVCVGLFAAVLRDRQNLQLALKSELATSARARSSSDSLARIVASRDSLIAGLTGRGVAVMTLTASGAKAPFARMFWDQLENTWTLVAHDMPALPAGRTYQLWLVTPSAKISAGTFQPANGDAVVRATYALAPDSLRALAVTEEPAGGSPQPTSAPLIAVVATK
ncbi:MAG TPA: anti-sigma factor [Gemmatimonadaceae bacterium]|nr:anti-sigma factor [Gemmatimonadaceae bacterium]